MPLRIVVHALNRTLVRRTRMLFVTLGAVYVVSAFASAAVASAAGQFPVLQSGFTQELYGTAAGFFGGVAFAPNADVWGIHVDGDLIFASDISAGLYILRVQ